MILLLCVLIPRGFCGYLCPLGTLIDLFDWAIAGRVGRFRVAGRWLVGAHQVLSVGRHVDLLPCVACWSPATWRRFP